MTQDARWHTVCFFLEHMTQHTVLDVGISDRFGVTAVVVEALRSRRAVGNVCHEE